jgi:hypothetical protein
MHAAASQCKEGAAPAHGAQQVPPQGLKTELACRVRVLHTAGWVVSLLPAGPTCEGCGESSGACARVGTLSGGKSDDSGLCC